MWKRKDEFWILGFQCNRRRLKKYGDGRSMIRIVSLALEKYGNKLKNIVER